MKFLLSLVVLVSIWGCSSSPTPPGKSPSKALPITSWNFDWDDNIMYTQTPIFFYEKKTRKEKALNSEEFAEARLEIGKPGKWKNYEIDPNPLTGTFRFFREGSENYFLKYVKETVEKSLPKVWEGPSWKKFLIALNDPRSARYTTIITARGHSSQELADGLKYLQQKGMLKILPPAENLYAVTHSGIKERLNLKDPLPGSSQLKAIVMEQILDKIEAQSVQNVAVKVYDRDGNCCAAMHLWGFSDDDYDNYETAVKVLGAKVKSGKWPHIKLTFFYTGRMKKDVKPHAVILKSDGTTRPQIPMEVDEAERVLSTLIEQPVEI